MKLILYVFLVILGILLIGSFFYFTGSKQETQEIEKKNLIMSWFSAFGNGEEIYLFEDRTFIETRSEFFVDINSGPCYEGEISPEEYTSFVEFIDSSGFFDAKITQKRDKIPLLCEGSDGVRVNINSKSNSISSPCVAESSESTIKILKIKNNISNELYRIINSSKQTCREGAFIKTISYADGCGKKQGYETYSIDNLDPNLKKGLMYERAYVYVGPTDETTESYNRKNFKIGDSCYLVLLSEFDGELFR